MAALFVVVLLAASIVGRVSAGAGEPETPLYKRPAAPVEQRVADLLARMTLREKLAQITGWWPDRAADPPPVGQLIAESLFRKHLADGVGTIGPVQLSLDDDVRFRNAAQTFLRDKTRLGIPVIFHDEGCHGLMKTQATSFPMPIGLACSWDEVLFERAYYVVGREMRARGAQLALTPILDVARDPRWGRIEETLGEDPFLNGRLGAAAVRGLQGTASGEVGPEHVMSTLKHFVGHGTPEGGLNRSPACCGLRELREVHLAPFEHVLLAAHPAAVMPSYNEVDGVPSHANRWLLQDVLRTEFGFGGLIVSDYDGVQRLCDNQQVAASSVDAADLALRAGVQMELPNGNGFLKLEEHIRSGRVDVQRVDEAVRAVLTAKFKLGLFENALADPHQAWELVRREESRRLALRAAEESIVLLKNEGGLLPLKPDRYRKIAVIGPNADIVRLGGYSGTPLESVSVLEGIRRRTAGQAAVVFAPGSVVVKNDHRNAFANWSRGGAVQLATLEENRPRIAEAQRVAAGAEVVVLVLGDVESTCREAWAPDHLGDRASLDLPGSQMDLARAVLAAGKPVVVYLVNGRPAAIGELKEHAAAIVEGWYMGQAGGTAAAEILFGDVSPSGKLTVSFPQSAGHLPAYYSRKCGAADFDYLFGDHEPLFSFGDGLSYTRFAYSKPRLAERQMGVHGSTAVSVEITNTGAMAGDEIAQVYVHKEVASVTRPRRELRGFRRIHLTPGETQTVTFPLSAGDLAFYDIDMHRRAEPGIYQIMVGSSLHRLESVGLEVVEEK
jgi:beta-glucosidase